MQEYSRLEAWSKVYMGIQDALTMARAANDTLLARRLANMLADVPAPKPAVTIMPGQPVSLGVPQWDRSCR